MIRFTLRINVDPETVVLILIVARLLQKLL